jgi:hypothetical protein
MQMLLPKISLPPSKREYAIQDLNLIRMLTQNRIADFHTTLETHDATFLPPLKWEYAIQDLILIRLLTQTYSRLPQHWRLLI